MQLKIDFFWWNFNKNFFLNKTALHIAIVNENVEIVQLLLASEKIDTNIIFISNKILIKFDKKSFFKWRFKLIYLNSIPNSIFLNTILYFNIFNEVLNYIIKWNFYTFFSLHFNSNKFITFQNHFFKLCSKKYDFFNQIYNLFFS